MFTQDQRISISRSIVTADTEKATIDRTIAVMLQELEKNTVIDLANKSLMDINTPAINAYQLELGYIDGVVRTELLEQDLQDAVKRKEGNVFFLNDRVATPSVPTGLWIYLTPLLLNKAIGKNKLESYGSNANFEDGLIPAIINSIDSFLANYTIEMERVTGQRAYTEPTPPPPTDYIVTFTALRAELDAIIALVANLLSALNSEKAAITTNPDSNASRQTTLATALSEINDIISAVQVWQGYQDYNTAHGQTTVAGFYAYNPALLYPTKGQQSNLQALRSALLDRQAYLTARTSQITGYLGTVTQNTTTDGKILSVSGLYGDRASLINLRLSVVGGSLSKIQGSEIGFQALNSQKDTIDLAVNVYLNSMKATLLEAATNGTNYVNVDDASEFSVGDRIYIVSDTQDELSCVIQEIVGKRLLINITPPPKYRRAENGRVYKEL